MSAVWLLGGILVGGTLGLIIAAILAAGAYADKIATLERQLNQMHDDYSHWLRSEK